jgi:hypothetical protein
MNSTVALKKMALEWKDTALKVEIIRRNQTISLRRPKTIRESQNHVNVAVRNLISIKKTS